MTAIKGKIGVIIEDHFDPTEYRRFNEYFPTQGYEVEYLSHLWGQSELHFGSNPEDNVVKEQVTVSTEVNDVDPSDYAGIILIGAYATDRLRYQVKIKKAKKTKPRRLCFYARRWSNMQKWVPSVIVCGCYVPTRIYSGAARLPARTTSFAMLRILWRIRFFPHKTKVSLSRFSAIVHLRNTPFNNVQGFVHFLAGDGQCRCEGDNVSHGEFEAKPL